MWKPFEALKPKKAAQGAKTDSKSFIRALLRTFHGTYKWSQEETRMLLNKKEKEKGTEMWKTFEAPKPKKSFTRSQDSLQIIHLSIVTNP